LDEAGRMLDMGFIHDIRKVLALLPKKRHNLLFSASMAPEMEKLAHSILVNPLRVAVTPPSSTAEMINQSVLFVDKAQKFHWSILFIPTQLSIQKHGLLFREHIISPHGPTTHSQRDSLNHLVSHKPQVAAV